MLPSVLSSDWESALHWLKTNVPEFKERTIISGAFFRDMITERGLDKTLRGSQKNQGVPN